MSGAGLHCRPQQLPALRGSESEGEFWYQATVQTCLIVNISLSLVVMLRK